MLLVHMRCHGRDCMRVRERAEGFWQGCARCKAAGQPRLPLALVMASGLRIEGAGLRVGMAGGRSVIGNASQWGRGAKVASSAIGGQKTAAMEAQRPKPHA